MFEYLNEFDDMEMDVQVGPQEEIEAEVGDAPEELTPVDIAKKDPESIAVAAVEKKDDECEECEHEFYVDAKDVAKYADLNEETMLEALNDIINVNEKYGMRADNLVVVVSESTMNYARNLEKNGCALMFIKEGDEEFEEDDIEMDVQVGPDGEEKVAEDPQEANPVDAVKREYDSVVVAKDDDEFFVDVEDVQKCADINCESVIETLNGIIKANEASGITAQNLGVIISKNADPDAIELMEAAGVNFFIEAGTKLSDINGCAQLANKLIEFAKKKVREAKGDKEASAKYIQAQIDKIDEIIERINEEIKLADEKGFKPTATRIAKNFFAYFSLLFICGTIGGVIGGNLGNVTSKIKYKKDAYIWSQKRILEETVPFAAIISAVEGFIYTAFTLSDYKQSLKVWKVNLLEEKKRLEKLLK